MTTPAIETVVKMLETLPEPAQDRVVEHLRDYLEDMQDELRWDEAFARTQPQLAEAARHAKRAIADGKAMPFDLSQL